MGALSEHTTQWDCLPSSVCCSNYELSYSVYSTAHTLVLLLGIGEIIYLFGCTFLRRSHAREVQNNNLELPQLWIINQIFYTYISTIQVRKRKYFYGFFLLFSFFFRFYVYVSFLSRLFLMRVDKPELNFYWSYEHDFTSFILAVARL
jgi:hypothetical protein